jgi:putative DNA primase/helicase
MADAASISRALKGRKSGNGYLCRCPAHADARPSLLVSDRADGGGLRVNCLAGCDFRDVLDKLKDLRLLEDRGQQQPIAAVEIPPPEPNSEGLSIWRNGSPIAEPLAQSYLRDRGLFVDVMPTLRFLPVLEHKASRRTFPAMVALILAGDRLKLGVQATFLDPRGQGKAPVDPPRWTFAPLRDGAVRLGPAGDALGIAEGVETALAAMQLTGIPCWACLGASRMHNVAIPDIVRELHVFGDNDQPGRDAAQRMTHAHKHRRVVLRFPPDGFGDYADVAADMAKRGVAA